MRVKCYSVRVASIAQISPKAYKISSFNGSEDIIPTSCVYGYDYDVVKCDAYWIASWILEKKNLQYSDKKVAWFDKVGFNTIKYGRKQTYIDINRKGVA